MDAEDPRKLAEASTDTCGLALRTLTVLRAVLLPAVHVPPAEKVRIQKPSGNTKAATVAGVKDMK